jgi:hypothetical protein
MRSLALCAVVLLSACFEPRYPPGNPCAEDGWCPPGQVCAGGVCRFPGFPPPPPDARPGAPDAALPDDPRLALLAPSAGTLSPPFDPGVTEYALSISQIVGGVGWVVQPSNPLATVRIDGATVTPGMPSPPTLITRADQVVRIDVTPPEGSPRVYTIMVRRDGDIEQGLYAKASNTASSDAFGWSVALGDGRLVVGAPLEDSNAPGVNGDQDNDGATSSGAVYVFRQSDAGWVQEAYLKPAASGAGDEFGLSVALDGDTLAVGAYGDDSSSTSPADNSLANSGAVYVFRRAGTTWAQEAYLKASNPGVGDEFGLRVALHGDTLVVGAPYEDSASRGVNQEQGDESVMDSGAVYVFRRTGSGWAQEAYIKASNTGAQDRFGYGVAVAGELIAASARNEDSGALGVDGNQNDETAADSGAVYLFRRSGTTWAQEAYLKASNTGAGDEFGYRVAAADELVVVGAWQESSNATGVDGDGQNDLAASSGAAYVFGRDGQEWRQRGYLKASNTGAEDLFGASVAAHGGLIAVGAPGEASSASGVGGPASDDSAPGSGAVYLFRCMETCAPLAYLKASNTGEDDAFGHSVSWGLDGLMVGAPYEDSGATGAGGAQGDDATDTGAAYLFR